MPRVEAWLRGCGHRFEWTTPDAGAFIYARYELPMDSTALTDRLREEESVLVVPGDAFGMDGYLRLGVGENADYVLAGLDRFKAFLDRTARDAPECLSQGVGVKPATARPPMTVSGTVRNPSASSAS